MDLWPKKVSPNRGQSLNRLLKKFRSCPGVIQGLGGGGGGRPCAVWVSEASLREIMEVLDLLGLSAPGGNLELREWTPWSFAVAPGLGQKPSRPLEPEFRKGSQTASGLRAAGGGGDFPFLPRFPFNYQHSYRSQAVRTAPDSRARLREPGLERESLRGEQVRQDAAGLGRKKITALFGALRVTELNCAPFPPGREPGRRAGDANGEAARKARKLQAGK